MRALLVLALPIMDTAQVVIGRLRRGIRNPLRHPDKTHIHHRLLARTASARRTAVIMWLLALVFGLLGMVVQGGVPPLAIAGAAAFVLASLAAVALARVRAHHQQEKL